MNILTWNLNGIRATKVRLKELFERLNVDIICIQETKVTRDMLDERSAIVDGFNSYFSFSNARTGYSGVATFVRDGATPVKAEEGLSGGLCPDDESGIGSLGNLTDFTEEELASLDREGRTIITQHSVIDDEGKRQLLTVINVYCPRADPEREDRKAFKIQFYKLLQIRAEALLQSGSHVIVLGDVNTSHRRIDHCDPDDPIEFKKNPGRQWLDQFLWQQFGSSGAHPSGQFVDTFRYFHPNQSSAFTCWNTMIGARATNYGTRIDYIFADKVLATTAFKDCIIMPEVEGSDHCPVRAGLSWAFLPAKKCPPLCTKYFPEFQGVQTKLMDFFKKTAKRGVNNSDCSQETSESSSQESDKSQTHSQDGKTKSGPPPAKKQRTDDRAPGLGKQSSLMSFFGKGKPPVSISKSSPQDAASQPFPPHRGSCPPLENVEGLQTKLKVTAPTDCSSSSVVSDSRPLTQARPTDSSAWKALLKGLPPAPLCKGHKEPCLLRTVKKDSLNKGRQFYVCPRPDGHRSNPEARCDHFVWVEKKKKPK